MNDDAPPEYAELHCLSAFSFQRGASTAKELFERAKKLGYAALAITDECSLAGIVRAFNASRDHDLPLIVGDTTLSFSYATDDGELETRWKHNDRLPSVVRITLSGTSPLPWSQSTFARPRTQIPASCGAKDRFAACAAALEARRP